MNNKTRIRLHLSKNLFESLSREILAEAKINGGGAYTVAVKQPKQPKQSKSQATSPEVQKTDAEAVMGEETAPTATGNNSASKLGADMIKKGQAIKSTPGLSAQELKNIQAILDLITDKAPEGETTLALQKALNILTQNTKNIKGDEQPTATKQQTHSPGSDYTKGSFMGQRGEEKPSKFTSGVAKPAANQRFEEMETMTAEDEIKEVKTISLSELRKKK